MSESIEDGKFPIIIRGINGSNRVEYVDEKTTVSELKQRVNELFGIPEDGQRLIYNGKQLEDNYKLNDYNVTADSLIAVTTRMVGGKK